MKIVGFESGTGPHLGVVEGDQVIDRAQWAAYPMSAVAVAVTRGFSSKRGSGWLIR
jgi:hypothetical protein